MFALHLYDTQYIRGWIWSGSAVYKKKRNGESSPGREAEATDAAGDALFSSESLLDSSAARTLPLLLNSYIKAQSISIQVATVVYTLKTLHFVLQGARVVYV